ncbi:MAG: TRAP transporter substrate-binding protein DctP, partial [Acidobacteriota bacterium]
MNRRTTLVLLAALLAAPAAGAQAVRLKIATIAPDGSQWINKLSAAADEIVTRTNGRVSLRFYPGGVMGSDQAVLRKIRIGQLQGGVVLAGSLASSEPNMEIYNLPLLFRSYEEVDAVRAKMDARLIGGLEEKGFVSFGFIGTGFTYLLSTKPTRSFD